MIQDQALMLAAELAHHRYWRVVDVGLGPTTSLQGPDQVYWVRLAHRTQPDMRYAIPSWPEDPEELAASLLHWGKVEASAPEDARAGLRWYWPGEFDTGVLPL